MLPALPIALLVFYVYPMLPTPLRRAIVKTLDLIVAMQERNRP